MLPTTRIKGAYVQLRVLGDEDSPVLCQGQDHRVWVVILINVIVLINQIGLIRNQLHNFRHIPFSHIPLLF